MAGHISPKSTYFIIFGALMVCTVLTVTAAFINLGDLNFPVALTIAVFKATLVVLFFMHVKYGSKLTKLIVGVAFFFLGIMLTLTLTDYLSRGWFTATRGSTSAGSIVNLTGPNAAGRPEILGSAPGGQAPQNTSPK
jgi:cytochrome c oxidase subunit 4